MKKQFLLLFLSLYFSIQINAQWIWTNGPYGGRVQAMTSIGSKLLVSTVGAGVFLSSDSGRTWDKSNNGLPSNAYYYTTHLASNSSYIFAGGTFGLYKSSDFGMSWNFVFQDPIHGLMVNDTVLIISVNASISISSDNGNTWTSYPHGAFLATKFGLIGKQLYVGTNTNGLYVLNLDSGIWNSIPGIPDEITGLYIDEDYILVSSVNATYLSRDSALTWTINGMHYSRGPFFHFANRYYAGGNGLIVLDTLTDSWNIFGNLQSERITTFTHLDSSIFVGTDHHEGVYTSLDSGINWQISNTGLSNVFASDNMQTDEETIVVDDCPGFAMSFDEGSTWTYLNAGGAFVPCDLPPVYAMKDSLILSVINNGLAFSIDTGKTWSPINNGLSTVYSIAIDGNNYWAGTDDGLFLSTDLGATWTARNTNMSNLTVNHIQISGQIIYVGAKASPLGPLVGIYYSSDYGMTWSGSLSGFPGNSHLSKISLMGSIAFAAIFDEGIYMSDNNGSSWTLISNWSTNLIVSMAVSGTNIFIGSMIHGIYLSEDTGQSWVSIQQGLLRGPTQLATSNTFLYASVGEASVWKRSLTDILLSTNKTEKVPHLAVFPNPADNKLFFSVVNSIPGRAKIEISNLSGAIVYSKYFEPLNLFFSNEIDLTDFENGFYVLDIKDTQGRYISSEKFIIQR